MKNIELVFRTIEERTSKLALQLAQQHIQPQKTHIIRNVQPFAAAVQQMLGIDYQCDFVVFMDADCLIMEDMRPFLDRNTLPYTDCYVLDKFRGKLHTGVHITRIDVVREMQKVTEPQNDKKYALRPESRIRAIALKRLKLSKSFKNFRIFHDFGQHYTHIFAKYALRELRSRTPTQKVKLEYHKARWDSSNPDFAVANKAVEYSRHHVSETATPAEIEQFIAKLPKIAQHQTAQMHLPPKPPLTIREIAALNQNPDIITHFESLPRNKIFGIGLSRTATKSLTKALNQIGYTIVHYPTDETTFSELTQANYRFSLLNYFDGITDITVAPFFPQLDRLYPGSKFILTIRDKATWLDSLENHWAKKPLFDDHPDNEIKMQLRRFLRLATYGTYRFSRERMSYVFDQHLRTVKQYFANRPDDLLIMNISAGDGWEKLCHFLNKPVIENEPFPYAKSAFRLMDNAT